MSIFLDNLSLSSLSFCILDYYFYYSKRISKGFGFLIGAYFDCSWEADLRVSYSHHFFTFLLVDRRSRNGESKYGDFKGDFNGDFSGDFRGDLRGDLIGEPGFS